VERRNYTRQPLQLHATLVRPGTGITEGTVSDFCLGGLFLSLNASDPPVGQALAQIDVGENVQVQFASDLGGAPQPYSMRAWVAGIFKGGIGCEFFDPDPGAIQALHEATVAHQASASPKPSADNISKPSTVTLQVVAELRANYSTFLRAKATALFKKAEESLFISARDAENNVQQSALLDTMTEVERLREPVERHFVNALVGHIDRLGTPMDALKEPDSEASKSELSLVESGNLPTGSRRRTSTAVMRHYT
jgi:hypothetical protein